VTRGDICLGALARRLDEEWAQGPARPRAQWLGPLLLALSVTALAHGAIAGPDRLSRSDLAAVLALVLAIVGTPSANGRALAAQRLMLAVLSLLSAYLAVVTRANVPIGVQLIGWLAPAGTVAVMASLVLARQPARARGEGVGYTAVDVAMVALALMVGTGYLGLYVAFWLNALPFRVRTDLLWVVLGGTALNLVFVPLLKDPAALRRGLRLSLLPLVVLGLAAVYQLGGR
jgi:hypothetical protein